MNPFKNWLRSLCLAGAIVLGLSANAHAQWQPLGGPPGLQGNAVVGAPTCFSLTTGASTRVDCYVKGGDGGLWRRSSPNGEDWSSAWQSLAGAPFFDMPECVWSLPFGIDRIDCFVVFNDLALWQRTSENGGVTWGPWISRGGRLIGRPSCVIWAARQINCYGWFEDGSMRFAAVDGAQWRAWAPLAGGFNGDPHCVAWINGASRVIDCFAPTTNGTLMRYQQPASVQVFAVPGVPLWTPVALPNSIGHSPRAFNCRGPAVRAKVECYAYVTVPPSSSTNTPMGSGTQILQLSSDPSPLHWSRFTGSAPSPSTPDNQVFMPSCAGMDAGIVCFTVVPSSDPATNGHLQLWANYLSAASQRNLAGGLTSSPSCVSMPDNVRAQCFGRGTDGNLWRIIIGGEIATLQQPDRTTIMRCRPGMPGCQN